MSNLLDDLPVRTDAEVFTEILAREGVRIERIVSTGQFTPVDKPYRQDHDEWVLLLAGAAGLWIEGEGERFGDEPAPEGPVLVGQDVGVHD